MDYHIALSGLNAAQKALEVIGNNIANAATEGYHRQAIELTPINSLNDSDQIGEGVEVAEITRLIDTFLQDEILQQQSSLGQVSQELDILSTVETVFGELSDSEGLNAAIDEFFNTLQELSAHPTDVIYQSQAVSAAETMTAQFRVLGEYLTKLESQITLEAENTIEQANTLINQIGELNGLIHPQETSGLQANSSKDQRDQLISELSQLIDIEMIRRDDGVVDVSIAGIPVVSGAKTFELEAGFEDNLDLSLSIAGKTINNTNLQGGQLTGLFSLKNEIISDLHDDLDTLANAIIQQVNEYHVQGIGSDGSFTELTGWSMASEDLADFDPPLSDGTISIRVTNTTTGETTRTTISVDTATDSLTTLANKIDAIPGLSASVYDSRLHIQADTNYAFDFLPSVLESPTASDFTGTTSPPTVSVSGIYTGTENQTFTFTVSGTGSVGNGTLQITVTNGDGETVKTLNVGSGYPAGETLDLGNGIKIALSTGDLADGNTFEVDAFAETDTSGVLAAVGLNTFFSGNSAANMTVSMDIIDSPGRIATALGSDGTDNTNTLRMQETQNLAIDSLNSMTPGEFYRQLVTDTGQLISVREIRQDSLEAILQNLANQESEISGVDVNDEAAQMLVFEQMYNAMAKYLTTVQVLNATLMEIV
ncbi:MAG: flagellar hook-associated protein FlgK [Sedimentisphaerales bacterium]|nr:flagellar hook-associated protein FlgK [Sedimentisphaerales bacterium]